MSEFVNLTLDNIDDEHICCIIRKKFHPGIDAKKKWLKERIKEDHIFRKLNVQGTVFIEFAPLEKAWVPIVGDNYLYIYCLWVLGEYKGKGYGRELMEYCISYAKENGKSGICMLGAKKQKAWLSDQSFAQSYGFKVVDTTENDYNLLALSFDETVPQFASNVKKEIIDHNNLTIYYDMQCPFIYQNMEIISKYCEEHNIPLTLNQIDSLEKAKELPCVCNNYAVFYDGKFVTVNLIDVAFINRLLNKK